MVNVNLVYDVNWQKILQEQNYKENFRTILITSLDI